MNLFVLVLVITYWERLLSGLSLTPGPPSLVGAITWVPSGEALLHSSFELSVSLALVLGPVLAPSLQTAS